MNCLGNACGVAFALVIAHGTNEEVKKVYMNDMEGRRRRGRPRVRRNDKVKGISGGWCDTGWWC